MPDPRLEVPPHPVIKRLSEEEFSNKFNGDTKNDENLVYHQAWVETRAMSYYAYRLSLLESPLDAKMDELYAEVAFWWGMNSGLEARHTKYVRDLPNVGNLS